MRQFLAHLKDVEAGRSRNDPIILSPEFARELANAIKAIPARRRSSEPAPATAAFDKSIARDLVTAGFCAYRDSIRERGIAGHAALTQREVNDLVEGEVNRVLGRGLSGEATETPTDTEPTNG